MKNENDLRNDEKYQKEQEELQRLLSEKLRERDCVMEASVEETIRQALEMNLAGPQVREKKIGEDMIGEEM